MFNLLKVSQGKFTTECINFLVDNGYADDLAASLKRWQTEQNLRAPVLLWIVKNRHSKKFAKLLNDLITPRLLSAIFFGIDYEALQAASARRIPLADILSEDPDLIADLLSTADPETARDLANTLLLNQGFEELTKKSLLARFIKIFPNIQSLVAERRPRARRSSSSSPAPSYDRRREEYETIVSKKIPENSRAIAAAREHGDLRENSEYKMAKQDQQVLMAQKASSSATSPGPASPTSRMLRPTRSASAARSRCGTRTGRPARYAHPRAPGTAIRPTTSSPTRRPLGAALLGKQRRRHRQGQDRRRRGDLHRSSASAATRTPPERPGDAGGFSQRPHRRVHHRRAARAR